MKNKVKKLLGIFVLGLLLTQLQYQTLKASNHEIMNGVEMAAVVYDGEDLVKAQIIKTCLYDEGGWTIPLYLHNINGDTLEGTNRDGKYGGLPLDQNIIVRVKLEFNQDTGFVNKATMINTRVNERWTRHIFVLLASSALRAIVLCQPRNGYFDTAPTHLWLNLNWRKATK